MPINIFLLEILVDQSRLFTLPVITDRMCIEFTLLNDGSKIRVQDNEFKQRHEYACSTCMFTLAKKHVEIPPKIEEPPPPPIIKGKPSKGKVAPKPSREPVPPEPDLSPQVMLVEVFKENTDTNNDVVATPENRRHFIGQGQVYMKNLFDKIADAIEVFDKSTDEWEEKRQVYEQWKILQDEMTTAAEVTSSKSHAMDNNDSTDAKPTPPPPKPSSIYPVTDQYKAMYPLRDLQQRICGTICILLRLTCFGTSFEVSPEMRELQPRARHSEAVEEDELENCENNTVRRTCRHKCIK